MNYKKIQFRKAANFENNHLINKSNETETEEQSIFNEKIGDLLQILNSNSSFDNINSALQEITSLLKEYDLPDEWILMKFNDQGIFEFFFTSIFSDQILSYEAAFQNIELILKILFFFSKSFFFSDSYGYNFINLFFSSYGKYDLNCQNLGILTVNQIINISNNDYTNIFDQSAIIFLISIFPNDLNSNQIVDSLSLLYTTIAQKTNLTIDILKQLGDVLKKYIKDVLKDYNDGSAYIFENYTKYMLIFLQHEPPIKEYMKEYFPSFVTVYNFCSDDVAARNNIFDIYTILIKNTKKKFYYDLVIGVNSETISFELKNKPDRRLSIFNFFLAAVSRGLDIHDHINRTVFGVILQIVDELNCECLDVVNQLLDSFVVNNQIVQNDQTLEVYSKIVNIFLKMLGDENKEFQTQVLKSIINLAENMSNHYNLKDIRKIFLESEDFDNLDDMKEDHDEAQFIIDNLEVGFEDELSESVQD